LIELEHLTVRYPKSEAPALDDVSLTIERGETILLLAPSGGGKSTLARVLSGLIPQGIFAFVEGRVRVGEIDPLTAPQGLVAGQVGLLFQDPESSFATLTVEDEIAFGLENLRVAPTEMPGRIRHSLEQVGLMGLEKRRLDRLSGGEAQRIALACLLAMAPPVLVLDEPTANLDPASTREFFDRLAILRPSHTVLLIEHKLDACLHLADRVVLLDGHGRLITAAPSERVFEDYRDVILETGSWLPGEITDPAPVAHAELAGVPPPAAMHGLPAAHIEDLTFAYPGHPPILSDVSLDIPRGAFFALIGPNGSGKTTLARLMMGLLPPPEQGEIRIFGDALDALTLADLTERVGFVFQNPEHQFVTNSVRDELAFSLTSRDWPKPEVESRVAELLTRFELTDQASQNPFTLSQGQKRRLSVATMLAVGQRMLILDEPTLGQDRRTTQALMESLCALNRQGVTILIITHDMQLVRSYAQTAAVLLDGRIAFAGQPYLLFEREELMRAARLL
jgi:energy-coupling factor transporter ATP-binding protein EcfA2